MFWFNDTTVGLLFWLHENIVEALLYTGCRNGRALASVVVVVLVCDCTVWVLRFFSESTASLISLLAMRLVAAKLTCRLLCCMSPLGPTFRLHNRTWLIVHLGWWWCTSFRYAHIIFAPSSFVLWRVWLAFRSSISSTGGGGHFFVWKWILPWSFHDFQSSGNQLLYCRHSLCRVQRRSLNFGFCQSKTAKLVRKISII